MKNNILFMGFLFCVVQVYAFDIPDEFIDEATRECLKELNLDKKILLKICNEGLTKTNLDEDGIKLMKCGISKGNYYAPNGEFDRDAVIVKIVKTIKVFVEHEVKNMTTVAAEFFEKCKTRKGQGVVEEMSNLNICLMQQVSKL
ncbi:hypothetical protein RI129_009704 [Pyrocoelia pectoralis]|uniref:Uncharacterized protein n=1 Tax=Pyrocoelia pectoralis TaxID=417401 RepID=A0AAN7V578_9COLE